MATNLAATSKQQVIDLINADNSTALTDAHIAFAAPTALVGDVSDRNTSVVVNAIQYSGYSGSVTIFYNRMDLGDLEALADAQLALDSEADLNDVITAFNVKFGTNLQIGTDIPADTIVPAPDNDGEDVVLSAMATSLAWIGSITVDIALPQTPLDTVITTLILDGLELPESI